MVRNSDTRSLKKAGLGQLILESSILFTLSIFLPIFCPLFSLLFKDCTDYFILVSPSSAYFIVCLKLNMASD